MEPAPEVTRSKLGVWLFKLPPERYTPFHPSQSSTTASYSSPLVLHVRPMTQTCSVEQEHDLPNRRDPPGKGQAGELPGAA